MDRVRNASTAEFVHSLPPTQALGLPLFVLETADIVTEVESAMLYMNTSILGVEPDVDSATFGVSQFMWSRGIFGDCCINAGGRGETLMQKKLVDFCSLSSVNSAGSSGP